jgi:hypothetical protein
MFDRTRRSWRLTVEAWNILRQDRELLMFPFLSGVCTLLALASFLIPIFLLVPWSQITGSTGGPGGRVAGEFDPGVWHYLLTFLFYLVTYFIVVFFNSGLVACARIRFTGGNPTVRDGFAFSIANVGRIFQWAVLSATVGTVLRTIEERVGWLGRLIVGLIGVAWSLGTAFVLPVLVYEGVGPVEAVKRSAQVFRKTWGETVIANMGLHASFSLLALAGMMVAIVGTLLGSLLMAANGLLGVSLIAGVWVACLIYCLALTIVQTALQGLFLTACYQYATTGEVPAGFTPEHIAQAWRPKRK